MVTRAKESFINLDTGEWQIGNDKRGLRWTKEMGAESYDITKVDHDCTKCQNHFSDPYDPNFCAKDYDLEAGDDCGGTYYKPEKTFKIKK